MNNEYGITTSENLQIPCRSCRKLVDVTIEDLREDKVIVCPKCDFSFAPNIDVEKLLELMKMAENAKLDSDLIM